MVLTILYRHETNDLQSAQEQWNITKLVRYPEWTNLILIALLMNQQWSGVDIRTFLFLPDRHSAQLVDWQRLQEARH